jgi:proteic killer suppression protein
MIRSFKDKDAKRLFEGKFVRRYRTIESQTQKRLRYLDAATSVQDLAALRSNRFETLEGDRKGQCSIRINRQWRICFRWTEEGAEDVEIVDYH